MADREKRLIDANALLESIEGTDWYTINYKGDAAQGAPCEEVAWYKATDIYSAIENAPTVDAVEVVHGRWKWGRNSMNQYGAWCSECECGWEDKGNDFDRVQGLVIAHKYCPNCGAKMDGGNEDG